MIAFLTAIFTAIASVFNYLTKSLVGLAATIYKDKFSPQAKAKKAASKELKDAVDSGDVSKVTSAFDKVNRNLVIALLLVFACGCSWISPAAPKPIILHPIDQLDIISLQEGQSISWTDINNVKHAGAPRNGFFLSDDYMKNVMGAKVEK